MRYRRIVELDNPPIATIQSTCATNTTAAKKEYYLEEQLKSLQEHALIERLSLEQTRQEWADGCGLFLLAETI
jgi:ATP-dependent Lon protease